MPRSFTARYKGKCKKCGGIVNVGDSVVFPGSKLGVIHASCDTSPDPGTSSPVGVGSPPAKEKTGDRTVIDFPELKETALAIYAGNAAAVLPINASYASQIIGSPSVSFTGFSATQAREWLVNGYRDEALEGLEDFAPPIREKRRFVYGEEGDEIDLSAAWSGEDNFMTHWTKRDVIPGISLEFEMAFQAGVSAELIVQYERWVARATEAIQAAGIDPEISIAFPGQLCGIGTRGSTNHTSLVRVKRPNEVVDIHSWSAMLSPATYRGYGFLSKLIHGERLGSRVHAGLSQHHGGNSWRVYFDPETQAIRTQCPFTPSGIFPEAEMTAQFKAAIEAIKKG